MNIDLQRIFNAAPGLFLVLAPDRPLFTILAVTDAFLRATKTRRSEIIGRALFEVFPDNPDDPATTAMRNTRASLDRVIERRVPDTMAVQRHYIRRPEEEGGFEERYWSPVNTPVVGENGEVAYLIHRVKDVTDFVRLKQDGAEQPALADSMRTRAGEMEIEFYRRAQEIQEVNRHLRAANERVAAQTEEIRQVNETLEQRIAERTAELQSTNAALLDSRQAALDIMEDAVAARRQAENANASLQREIAGRKRIEADLLRSKDEWERTFNSVPDLIAIIDDRHRVVRVNRAMAEHLGRDPDECVGIPCYEAVHRSNMPPEFCPHAMTMGDGREHNVELYEEWIGGDYLVSTTPLRDSQGRMTGSVHVARNITERKQAEEALRRAHDELEKRVSERTDELAANVVILREEIAGRERMEASLLRLNRLYAVLGETAQAIIRANDRDALFHDFCRIAVDEGNFLLSWVGLTDEESGQVRLKAACGATGYLDDIRISDSEEPAGEGPTGISIRQGTYCICNDFLNSPSTRPWHKRGRAHGIKSSASVALKEEGRVIGALTLYAGEKDFFDKQHVELLVQMGAHISFALDNIVREVRRNTTERALLEESAERLRVVEDLREKEQLLINQSRQAAMGEMINNIAHQWRQPLNTLGLMIQQLSLYYDLDRIDKEFLDHSVGRSMGLIQHMSKTIDDFRNYFKPDKEKIEFQVSEAIESTLTLLEGSLQNPKISIEIVAKNKPVITGYHNEFAQVILNILINARDALIEREINDPRVTVTIYSEDNAVVVTVADNAGGIPENIIGKIFDPYFTTKGPQQGTGVGLFMSKSIIEKNMGGRLSVRNSESGAEFRIEVGNESIF